MVGMSIVSTSKISDAYLMVHMTEMKDIRMETPGGKSVPSYIVPQTSLEDVNLGRGGDSDSLLVAAGIIMRTIHRAMMLNVDPTLLNCAIHLVGMLLIHPWMSMISVQSRKIW